ncbi:MAG: hypothetical protein ACREJN_20560 [Nitrospiraceae bacterium]
MKSGRAAFPDYTSRDEADRAEGGEARKKDRQIERGAIKRHPSSGPKLSITAFLAFP